MDETADPALYSRFLRGLALSSEGVAVRVGTESISYARAHELALLWAGALVRGRPRAVGVLAAKSITAYVGILAALYAGAAVVPLRPDFPVARTRQMLAAAGVSTVIVDDKGVTVLPELLADRQDMVVLAPGHDLLGTISVDPGRALGQPRPVASHDPAYLLFTSGSTGRPKGVVISHGNAAHYFGLLDARYDFTSQDVFSQTFDLNFDCAMFDVFCAWGAGAPVVALPPQAYRDLPTFLTEHRITVWFSTPSVIGLVRRMGGLGAAALPGLRWSFFAGEALQCRDAADWLRAAPSSVLENLYGPTELTVTVAAHRWSDERSPGMAVNGVVPIGVPHEGHSYLLLDEHGGPTEDEGELCVTGPQRSHGYLDPADDRGRFVDRDGQRWYRTGDRVRRIEDGELAYLGRLDSQVQVQGWRVELAEVEHALRTCAPVDDAVVVGVAGSGSTELFAFYTGHSTPTIELVRQLRRILPEGVVPRHYHKLNSFPLNPNRKVDRAELVTRAQELLVLSRN